MGLNRKAKGDLAAALIDAAANLIEFRDSALNEYKSLREYSTEEIAVQLTKWLGDLPGDYWDHRLPDPNDVSRGLYECEA